VDESIDEKMAELEQRIHLLESSLPTAVDGMICPESKLPFLVLWHREAQMWRAAELSRSAFESFRSNHLVSAIVLTRTVVETSAGVCYLHGKVQNCVDTGVLGNLHDDLGRLLTGDKSEPSLPNPINVLTFVDAVNKEVDGFRHSYDRLSEFAHPNWSGATYLYSKLDPPSMMVNFGKNIRGEASAKGRGINSLILTLKMFEMKYNSISGLMPAFIALCKSVTPLGPSNANETPS